MRGRRRGGERWCDAGGSLGRRARSSRARRDSASPATLPPPGGRGASGPRRMGWSEFARARPRAAAADAEWRSGGVAEWRSRGVAESRPEFARARPRAATRYAGANLHVETHGESARRKSPRGDAARGRARRASPRGDAACDAAWRDSPRDDLPRYDSGRIGDEDCRLPVDVIRIVIPVRLHDPD
jgi:hypothetical protein